MKLSVLDRLLRKISIFLLGKEEVRVSAEVKLREQLDRNLSRLSNWFPKMEPIRSTTIRNYCVLRELQENKKRLVQKSSVLQQMLEIELAVNRELDFSAWELPN
jgi:hypothetical protein